MSMHNVLAVLEEAERISSSNKKIETIKSLRGEDQYNFKQLADAALNPYRMYGVKWRDPKRVKAPTWAFEHSVREFLTLIGYLERRSLTGNDARKEVEDFLARVRVDQRDWFVRFGNKEFITGVGHAVLKKAGIIIPKFECQLAGVWDGKEKDSVWWAERKIDGMRCFIFCSFKDPQVLSRNGKPVYHLNNFAKELSFRVKECFGTVDYVVDGEIFGGSWEDTITAVKTHEKTGKSATFWMFDLIRKDYFQQGYCEFPLRIRRKHLSTLVESRFENMGGVIVRVVDHVEVRKSEHILQAAQKYVAEGYEGAVIKNPKAPYVSKRGHGWEKVKFTESVDVPVVSVEEGTGKFAGTLGALVVKVGKVKVGVGSGLTDEMREKYWKNPKKIIGKIVEIKHNGYTPEKSLRFPVFLRERPDKGN